MANELRHSDVGTALSKSEWEAVGGHIFNSQAAGDIMYASTTSQLTRLGIGTANQVLATNSGATAPEWVSGVNLATNVTVSANNSTDETVYPVFVDGATGTQGAETDTGLTYNPSSGVITATQFTGAVSGNATTATTATNVTASANNSTNETTYPTFVDGATGGQGIETDTGLTYNPSSGLLTATGFSGNLTGTLQTAAQGTVTSLGTLTALQVDYANINASTLTITDSTDTGDYASLAVTTHGATTLTTLDDDATAAHLTLDVDGNIELNADGGTITFADAGSSLGTITSSGYSGNAATATALATARI